MESLMLEGKHILFKFLTLIIIAPFFGYGILLIAENIIKSWKTKNRMKKWWSITMAIICLGIMLGWLL